MAALHLITDRSSETAKILNIAHRWGSEEAAVFAAELRGAFIADAPPSSVGID